MDNLNDSQRILNDFFTVDNLYSTGSGYFNIFPMLILLLFIIFCFFTAIRSDKSIKMKVKKSENPVVPEWFESLFKKFKMTCTRLGLGTPFKNWNSYQEYINSFNELIEKDKIEIQKEKEQGKLKLYALFFYLMSFILTALFMFKLYDLGMVPSNIKVSNENIATIHYNLKPNVVIDKSNVKEIELMNNYKYTKTGIFLTKTSYCEVTLRMKDGENIEFNIYSVWGKFPDCVTN